MYDSGNNQETMGGKAMSRTALVPQTRSSRTPSGKCDRELRVQRGTRIIELLVVLRFRSSYPNALQMLTNFGIGPLAVATAVLPSDVPWLLVRPLGMFPDQDRVEARGW